jgi:hypothetical protein
LNPQDKSTIEFVGRNFWRLFSLGCASAAFGLLYSAVDSLGRHPISLTISNYSQNGRRSFYWEDYATGKQNRPATVKTRGGETLVGYVSEVFGDDLVLASKFPESPDGPAHVRTTIVPLSEIVWLEYSLRVEDESKRKN